MTADDLSALPARKIAETRGNLLEMRATLSTPEGRMEGARKLQREADSTYAEQRYALALRTQLSALWLLAPGCGGERIQPGAALPWHCNIM